jgi:hypothetical protein
MTLDELPEGGVLADALRDGQNQLLLPEGTALDASTIASLRRRGVEQVAVRLPGSAAGEPVAEGACARRERIEQRLQHLFRHTAASGQVNPLMHMLPAYRLGDTP